MTGHATPQRFTLTGALLIIGALAATNAAEFLVTRRDLDAHVEELAGERRQLVAGLARDRDSTTLARILTDLGVEARVIGPGGEETLIRLSRPRSVTPSAPREPIVAAPIALTDGGVAEAFLPRDDVDRVITSLAVSQLLAVPIVVLLSILVLRRVVDDAGATADRNRRFLADAAHQMRTPVAAALAASQALLHAPATSHPRTGNASWRTSNTSSPDRAAWSTGC